MGCCAGVAAVGAGSLAFCSALLAGSLESSAESSPWTSNTIAQACRRSDVHQARYRGLPKTHLQHVLAALALNLVRVDAWLTGTPLGGSWVSRLTRLRPAPSPV